MATPLFCPPEVCWDSKSDVTFRRSWSSEPGYINQQHAAIWHSTEDIPGQRLPADSEKLYEMAYYSGAIIREIGTCCGRSAVVELRGALAARVQGHMAPPQFYGIDISLDAITQTYQTLYRRG